MDRGDWQATVHGVTRVGHNLVTKPTTIKTHFADKEPVKMRRKEVP